MAIAAEKKARTSRAEYGSDVIVDMLRELGIEYVALNPGASFRGLHDSLVNYGDSASPEMILCNHEGIAVAIAHGYSKAAGKPMAAAVHNIVGLLHATNAMFNATLDRTSMLVLGGTRPMAIEQRRPWIDWIHTALVQGNTVRDYIKWDDQPSSIPSIMESLLRAHQLTTTEPRGPVYICFDAALQEERLESPVTLPDISRYPSPGRIQADPELLERAAQLLVEAERPVVLAAHLGEAPGALEGLVRMAEGLALPVIDMGDLFNFPSRHSLNLTGAEGELLAEADVILGLNVYDLQQALVTVDRVARQVQDRIPASARVIDISLRQLAVRSWSQDFGRIYPVELSIAADTALAVPALADLCLRKLSEGPDRTATLRQQSAAFKARHDELAQEAAEEARRGASLQPISLPFLAQQVGEAVQGHDWVLTDNDLRGRARRLWDIKQPYQNPAGRGGGTGNGLARSVGVALANRGTGRLCVDFQADGDLLYNPGGLWTASHYRIPLLVVMYNNRAYYNDQVHQADMARTRGRPIENQGIGIRIEDPEVDMAAMARSFGAHGEGPVEHPEDLRPALDRAIKAVVEQGRCALVDVVTQNA